MAAQSPSRVHGGNSDAPSMLPPPSVSLILQLFRAREAVVQRFRPILRTYDLTEQQWRILRILDYQGEVNMLTLAKSACLHPPSLSRIVPKLKDRRLLTSSLDKEDGRQVRVALTPDGTAFVNLVSIDVVKVLASLQAEVGAPCLEGAHKALVRMLGALGEGDSSASAEYL